MGNTENYLCVALCLRDRNSHPGRGWAGRGLGAAGLASPAACPARPPALPTPRRPRARCHFPARARGPLLGIQQTVVIPPNTGPGVRGPRSTHGRRRLWPPRAARTAPGGSARGGRRAPLCRAQHRDSGTQPAGPRFVPGDCAPAPRRPSDQKRERLPGPAAASARRPVGSGRQRSELSRPSQPPASERTPEPVPPRPGRARPPSPRRTDVGMEVSVGRSRRTCLAPQRPRPSLLSLLIKVGSHSPRTAAASAPTPGYRWFAKTDLAPSPSRKIRAEGSPPSRARRQQPPCSPTGQGRGLEGRRGVVRGGRRP